MLDFLLGERVSRHAQFLRRVGDVPCREFVHAEFLARELAQFGQVALSVGLGALRQFIQEFDYLRWRFRHLRFQRIFGVVVKAQELRLLAPQLYDIGDERRVVQLGFAEFRGACGGGAIHQLAKRAVIRVLHHRHV